MDGASPPVTADRPSGRTRRFRNAAQDQRGLVVAVCGLLLMGSALLAAGCWLQLSRHAWQAQAVAPASGADVSTAPVDRWIGVDRGDTLWSLAVKHGPTGADPRRYVEAILRQNPGTDPGRLRPGQALYLPHLYGGE